MAEEKQRTKRTRADYKDTFAVVVGAEKSTFVLHTDRTTTKSKFFRAALNGKFEEAEKRLVSLPDVNVDNFQSYVHWIYTDEVVVVDEAELDEAEKAIPTKRHTRVGELYVLADRFEDQKLRNAAIDEFLNVLEETRKYPGTPTVQLAYEKTVAGSTLRKLLVDHHASDTSATFLEEQQKYLPYAFLFDVLLRMKRPPLVKPSKAQRCLYHEHNDDVPKCV